MIKSLRLKGLAFAVILIVSVGCQPVRDGADQIDLFSELDGILAKGQSMLEMDDVEGCRHVIEQYMTEREGLEVGPLSDLCFIVGVFWFDSQEFDLSQVYFERVEQLLLENGDDGSDNLIIARRYLGEIAIMLQQYPDAELYLEQVAGCLSPYKEPEELAEILIDLASLKLQQQLSAQSENDVYQLLSAAESLLPHFDDAERRQLTLSDIESFFEPALTE